MDPVKAAVLVLVLRAALIPGPISESDLARSITVPEAQGRTVRYDVARGFIHAAPFVQATLPTADGGEARVRSGNLSWSRPSGMLRLDHMAPSEADRVLGSQATLTATPLYQPRPGEGEPDLRIELPITPATPYAYLEEIAPGEHERRELAERPRYIVEASLNTVRIGSLSPDAEVTLRLTCERLVGGRYEEALGLPVGRPSLERTSAAPNPMRVSSASGTLLVWDLSVAQPGSPASRFPLGHWGGMLAVPPPHPPDVYISPMAALAVFMELAMGDRHAAPAAAPAERPATPPHPQAPALDKTVNMRFINVPLTEVLARLTEATGVRFVVDEALQGRIIDSLFLQNVNAVQAVGMIVRSLGPDLSYRWEMDGETPVYTVGPAPTTARGAPLESPAAVTVALRVVGAVAKPGVHFMVLGQPLADAVAAAGGFTEHADPSRALLVRRDDSVVPVNLAPEAQTDPPVAVRWGDHMLIIPTRE